MSRTDGDTQKTAKQRDPLIPGTANLRACRGWARQAAWGPLGTDGDPGDRTIGLISTYEKSLVLMGNSRGAGDRGGPYATVRNSCDGPRRSRWSVTHIHSPHQYGMDASASDCSLLHTSSPQVCCPGDEGISTSHRTYSLSWRMLVGGSCECAVAQSTP